MCNELRLLGIVLWIARTVHMSQC